ncbi:PaaI family thioesterase [Euzebya tangerina]|uniref:PaaI family thioesterase n=1 Tax=Euzebya tangerina TaxID=591198 RepID=UPI00196B264F|nr:PaaI family thioesterase [Euzebya tangerina]
MSDITDEDGNPLRNYAPEMNASRGGFVEAMGMAFTLATRLKCVAQLEITEAHHQPYGIVHGGVYCAIAETVASIGGALAARELGGPDAGAVGQSNHTDFLRATRSGTVTATATPVHLGRSVQLWNVDMADEEGQLVAQSKVRLFNVGVGRLDGS